ncbi:MAG: DUF3846 domain-containing protein [Clostridia bacterium]
MKILIVEPSRHPHEADIPHTLKEMQRIVGGCIEITYPWEDAIGLVCDDEGLYKQTEWNRYIKKDVAIKGTFFLCGLGEEDLTDLPTDLMEKYKRLLWDPHLFLRTPTGIAILDMKTGGVVGEIPC